MGITCARLEKPTRELVAASRCLSLKDVPAAHPLQAVAEAEPSVEAERRWLQNLCRGLQNLVEGGHTDLQLHLLNQGAAININFVAGMPPTGPLCSLMNCVGYDNFLAMANNLLPTCLRRAVPQPGPIDQEYGHFVQGLVGDYRLPGGRAGRDVPGQSASAARSPG